MIDFANMDPAKINMPAGHVGTLPRPPAPARDRVYATWPYERNTIAVPRDSSLSRTSRANADSAGKGLENQ